LYTDTVFEESFEEAGIQTERFTSQTALLSNFLWYGVAQSDDTYYVQFYSIFDAEDREKNIIAIPSNHHLLQMDHPDLQTLTWFSKGFYALDTLDSAKQIRYKDLRFPLLDENDKNSSLFGFDLLERPPRWDMVPMEIDKYSQEDFSKYFKAMINRSLGN
jgi:inner membrane protein